MTKTIGITKAREMFKTIGEEVQFKRENYVISRNGEPAFAIVPLHILESWERNRQKLLQVMNEVQAQNIDLNPDELMDEIVATQHALRQKNGLDFGDNA